MMDGDASISVLPVGRRQVVFDRSELMQILSVYGRFVSAGAWRDYSVGMDKEEAVFAVHARASEMPLYRIVKRPALARKQGQYLILGPGGQVLKRGSALRSLLGYFDTKLMKLVED